MTYESGMELDMFSGNFDNLLCCTVQNKCETASQAAEQAPIPWYATIHHLLENPPLPPWSFACFFSLILLHWKVFWNGAE